MQAPQAKPLFSEGLEGIVAGRTSICSLDDTLRYRGYAIEDLAENATFEETAYLLLFGSQPSPAQLKEFSRTLAEEFRIPVELTLALKMIPDQHPMAALRTAVSMLGAWEARDLTQPEAAVSLLAKMPGLLSILNRQSVDPPQAGESFAWNLLKKLSLKIPTPLQARAFDVSLILYAEHEFNASTFAVRLTASTRADYYAAIAAGIGALSGPLHGGANEEVMKMLLEIGQPEKAQSWIDRALAEKKLVMGFGHRVYKQGDPRAPILRALGLKLARQLGQEKWFETADIVQRTVKEKKGLHPNLDYPSALVYHLLGIPIPLFTPIFAVSRLTGWSAHFIEQSNDNRLIRPRAEYAGEGPRLWKK